MMWKGERRDKLWDLWMGGKGKGVSNRDAE